MKTISALLIAAIVLAAFKSQNQANARVDRLSGLDVYVYSVPVREYEVLKTGHPASMGCKNWILNPVKLASQTPNAEGVIINFENGSYQAIKYK